MNMPTLDEYLSDKAKIAQLERKILNLNKLVSKLRVKAGIKQRKKYDREKLIDALTSGASSRAAAKLAGCSTRTASDFKKMLLESKGNNK